MQKNDPLIGELLEPLTVNAQAIMVSGCARVLAEKSIAAAQAADVALRRWNIFEAKRLLGVSQAYYQASRRVLNLAGSL